ncbi:E3 ubiquitin-protein ligase XIAP-like isoform X3 [Biomphalaria glabrata]|uniref:E3 ubiquitin-protein ligase XIAP-like isoform X3 n=1 Tax=Biomphalaria glabrata TaxID=6526 RepID=A0A9W3A4X6_BIOGL|nr:E3 ubiquitin-protein ligase XIAP-like isoform X3 [Biomphalaria glabrata]XP_055882232.1 E3 ubiquitin-protein ligase XIAP-like isoform X3 [Biomphalaria glabrata]XP_055882233.1 E3 ubiquitin-protein ligase XIAP-like isoform X3 [Biomphalaria glabrata]XP_055882234.1 E3 ubiquitin-protein ligase XIAP-like isoform X3 [Biomphalaria glabrata]XP_055882235.1 E3 ubiquitin-protein ligase XIAP-like isoform X3 [Biomphalaria glabrata]
MIIPNSWEWDRLRTYVLYPESAKMSALHLAAAGFEYVGNGIRSTVMCVSCRQGIDLDLEEWMPADVFQEIHQQSSPACDFVNRERHMVERASNSAAASSAVSHIQDDDVSKNTHQNEIGIKRNKSDGGASGGRGREGVTAKLSPVPRERQARMRYRSKQARLKTFDKRQSVFPVDVRKMAMCGLYDTGEGDCVRCFSCGGGLKNWRINDHPCIEHIRSYPNCSFVKKQKSPEFYSAVMYLNACFSSKDQITKSMVKAHMLHKARAEILTLTEENETFSRRLQCRSCGVDLFGIVCGMLVMRPKYPVMCGVWPLD